MGISYVGFMSRLLKKRKEIGLTQVELAELAGTTQSTINKIENGSRTLSKKWAERFAPHLKTTPQELLFEDGELHLNHIRVEGVSQAGLFKDISLIDDNEFEREEIPIPLNTKYAHAHQYALKVAGDSMNRSFQDGSYVACASWADLGKELKPGIILHVERVKAASMVETTLKIYNEYGGKRWLEPNSTNPKHRPIEILGCEDTEIIIKGAVIGSYIAFEI